MRPTTLLLPDDLARDIKEAALREGISASELVRRAVRQALSNKEPRAKPRSRRRGGRPTSVWDVLDAPIGAYAHLALPGPEDQAEDPHADSD